MPSHPFQAAHAVPRAADLPDTPGSSEPGPGLLVARVIAHADAANAPETPTFTDVNGLSFVRARSPTAYESMVYEPLVCVVLQGAKETVLGERVVSFSTGQSLIVSLDLPARSRIRKASADSPYVALALKLDLDLIHDLDPAHDHDAGPGRSDPLASDHPAVVAGPADPALLDAMRRLFDLVERPGERPVMLPLLMREVHFRLLRAGHGGMLRRLARRDGQAARIARSVARLRRDYARRLSVADLARDANMSASTFHEHFKAVTATTPLQFQKALRLIEAREHLRRAEPVTSVALEVGYLSPAQFSRDYARHFGHPPTEDRRSAASSDR